MVDLRSDDTDDANADERWAGPTSMDKVSKGLRKASQLSNLRTYRSSARSNSAHSETIDAEITKNGSAGFPPSNVREHVPSDVPSSKRN